MSNIKFGKCMIQIMRKKKKSQIKLEGYDNVSYSIIAIIQLVFFFFLVIQTREFKNAYRLCHVYSVNSSTQ